MLEEIASQLKDNMKAWQQYGEQLRESVGYLERAKILHATCDNASDRSLAEHFVDVYRLKCQSYAKCKRSASRAVTLNLWTLQCILDPSAKKSRSIRRILRECCTIQEAKDEQLRACSALEQSELSLYEFFRKQYSDAEAMMLATEDITAPMLHALEQKYGH